MHDLSDYQRRKLLKNSYIEKITEKHIVYTAQFKKRSVEKYFKGKKPDQIFKDAGISPEFFTNNYCRLCLKRWKKKYLENGEDSFKKDKRGLGSLGRPKNANPDELTVEELKALVEVQQEVIEVLKKNRALAKKKRK